MTKMIALLVLIQYIFTTVETYPDNYNSSHVSKTYIFIFLIVVLPVGNKMINCPSGEEWVNLH